jgi:hypothetical protein
VIVVAHEKGKPFKTVSDFVRRQIHRAEAAVLIRLALRKWITAQKRKFCLFESCSRRSKARIFSFFPFPYQRFYVTCCYFSLQIGHFRPFPIMLRH